MRFLKRRKKVTKEDIERAIEIIDDKEFEIISRLGTLERGIKEIFLKGENPTIPKMIAYKRAKLLANIIEGFKDTLRGVALEIDIKADFDKIKTELPSVFELINSFHTSLTTSNQNIEQLIKMQRKYVTRMDRSIHQSLARMEDMSESVEEIKREFYEKEGKAILEELMAEDAEFAEAIPAEFKRK
ncbi:MAG: hypothetical protein GF364_16760 [Candidatus Lokiarchaeota archaeon]|nr:hypothetical protein [Candidatus Lokiarchaeota archaeon]